MTLTRPIMGPGLFRLLLALLVVIDHATRLALGLAAVYIFFALSGYWIATIWNAGYSGARRPYETFILSRIWRLLPVFILCSVFSILVAFPAHPVSRLLVADNIHGLVSAVGILGYNSLRFLPDLPAWSLDIELQFYLIAPVVVLLTRSIWAMIGFAVLSGLAYFGHDGVTAAPYLAFFAAGCVAANRQWKPDVRAVQLSVIGSCLVIALLTVGPLSGVLLGGAHPGPSFKFNGCAQILVAILAFPYAIHTTSSPSRTVDGLFRDLSYIIYLIHWPMLRLFAVEEGGYVHRALSLALAVAAIAVSSLAIWKWIDRPMARGRSKWVRGRYWHDLRARDLSAPPLLGLPDPNSGHGNGIDQWTETKGLKL